MCSMSLTRSWATTGKNSYAVRATNSLTATDSEDARLLPAQGAEKSQVQSSDQHASENFSKRVICDDRVEFWAQDASWPEVPIRC